MDMRIAVIGAGAVGGYCSGRLMQAGHDVAIVDQGAHLEAIQAGGLRVVTAPSGEFVVRPRAVTNAAEIGPVDLVIVSVQSQDTEAIAAGIRPLLGSDTAVIPLQNNVDNPDKLAEAVGANHVLAAAIFIASSRPEPGLIHQLAEQVKIHLGERNGVMSERIQRLAQILSDAGLPCVATTQVFNEMWGKFAFVVGFYLTAPLRSSAGEILDLAETKELHARLVQEVAAVAASRGIILSNEQLAGVFEATRYYGNYLPSSVQEIDEGRADEGEHMLRTVIRMGEQARIPTPMAEATLAFTRFMNQRNKRLVAAGKERSA